MGLLALPPVVDNDPSSYDDNQCDLSEQENQINEAINLTEPEDDDVESEAHGENEEVPATSENNCSKENEPLRGDIAEVTENMSFQPKNNTSNVKPESLPLKSGSYAGAGDVSKLFVLYFAIVNLLFVIFCVQVVKFSLLCTFCLCIKFTTIVLFMFYKILVILTIVCV